ncbi:hypothetical protein VNO77_41008 [Canavalia gladiata]|uniref:Uncharacterized protein n=1 Tax=Canavalia gladiata TaxID=3824 RepID=A0AAN9K202_CANGL
MAKRKENVGAKVKTETTEKLGDHWEKRNCDSNSHTYLFFSSFLCCKYQQHGFEVAPSLWRGQIMCIGARVKEPSSSSLMIAYQEHSNYMAKLKKVTTCTTKEALLTVLRSKGIRILIFILNDLTPRAW